MLVSEALF